jgi:hypothetical protein
VLFEVFEFVAGDEMIDDGPRVALFAEVSFDHEV